MKKFNYLIITFVIILMVSCGGNDVDTTADNNEQKTSLKGYKELDLNEWGFEMVLKVPNSDMNGDAEVTLTERGALEIMVGQNFGIEIMFGEGDIQLLKLDLKEDLIFVSEILQEEEDVLIYEQSIPNSGVKTKNHFFCKKQLAADIYEIRDLVDGTYGTKAIDQMIAAIRAMKRAAPKPPKKTEETT